MPLDNSGTQSFRTHRLKCKAIAGTPGPLSNEQTVPESTFVDYKLGRMPYLVQPSSGGPVTTDAGCCGAACPYQNSTILYRNETLAYMQGNYLDYIPDGAVLDSLILVIELSPSIGSAQVQDCINTIGEIDPTSLPFTYVNDNIENKTLIFTVVDGPYVVGDINVIVCETGILLRCVNCNIPAPIFESSPSILFLSPGQYNSITGEELNLTYPNLIFLIGSVCGSFNNVTKLYTDDDTLNVNILEEDEHTYIPANGFNLIKTNSRIPGLPEEPSPTADDVIAAIVALGESLTSPILASGTMVNSCGVTQLIVMYESFFGRSINYRSNNMNSNIIELLKGTLSDISSFQWFKKA